MLLLRVQLADADERALADAGEALTRAGAALGVALRPQPGSPPSRWWQAELPDDLDRATRTVERLRALTGVAAAFVAPAPELPSPAGD